MENKILILTEGGAKQRLIAIGATLMGILTVVGILNFGLLAAMVLLALPVIGYWVYWVFTEPRVGLVTLIFVNYFVMGVSRYVDGPLGLGVDSVMTLTYLALIFKSINHRGIWNPALRDITLLTAIWYAYAIFELANPEATSRTAWFYAMRGFSLYPLLTIPLTLMLFNKRADLDLFLKLWSVFTILAMAKGLAQSMGFVDPAEHAWLMEGGAKTHIVAGRLRIFSFFTDAGQFGASMGLSGVVFGITALGQRGVMKWYYLGVAILALVGLMLSGTRGAIAVPAAGLIMFIILTGNVKRQLALLVVMFAIFGFFKFTNIGNSNYSVARMRTAFSGKDASLQARLLNQKKLRTYLASRPFGGGIGSAGNWGQRFAPNSFLANVPTDSWYVSIWAEQGIVGLSLHLFILFYILIKGSRIRQKTPLDNDVGYKLTALICGLAGVMAASYSNGVIGQMPTGVITYMSMAFIFMAKNYSNETLVE